MRLFIFTLLLTVITSAAYAINPAFLAAVSGGGAAAPASLQDALASTVFHIDATRSESYSGSGSTWSNLVENPADSANQTDYNFTISGLTFNGTAGSAAAYFSTAGSGVAQIASNTTFTNALHKTTGGSDWWFLAAIQLPTDGSADGLFTTAAGAANINEGIRAFTTAADALQVRQHGNASTNAAQTTGTHSEAVPIIIIISHTNSTNETTFWMQSRTGETKSHTFATESDNATEPLKLIQDAAVDMQSGAEIYAFAMGNEYLNDTKATTLIDALEGEDWHNRDYTPP